MTGFGSFKGDNKRTPWSIIKGIWIRSFSIIAQFTFLVCINTIIHRMRGEHVEKGLKITRTVIIEDSRPDLITIGRNVWITS